MAEISIIIPAFNAEAYLAELLNQLSKLPKDCFEILLINDGSIDNTQEIAQSIAAKHSNIRVLNQANHGVSSARNYGLRQSTGKYIAFFDVDDEIDLERFKQFIDDAILNEAHYYFTGYQEKNYINNRFTEINAVGAGLYSMEKFMSVFFENVTQNLISYPINKLYLKSIITEHAITFDERLKFAEDLHFNLDYLRHVETIYISKSNFYIYHKHRNAQSLSSNFNMHFWESRRLVYNKMNSLITIFDEQSKLKRLQNTYAANVLIYTTRQIVSNPNVSKQEKMAQLLIVVNDEYLKEFIKGPFDLKKGQNLLLDLTKNKKVKGIFNFWSIFEAKDKLQLSLKKAVNIFYK